MPAHRRPIPDGFAADAAAGMSLKEAARKYHADWRTVRRWAKECNVRQQHKHRCPVAQCDARTGELLRVWHSIADAARAVYVSSGGINDCCRGKQKTAAGFAWRYWDDAEKGVTNDKQAPGP